MKLEKMDGVDVALRDGALTVTINRPERRNAVTPDQMNFIGQACAAAENDNDVRVVVIRGTGDAFCAGADLSDADLSASGGQIPPINMGQNLFLPVLELSKPLIGVVNGVAAAEVSAWRCVATFASRRLALGSLRPSRASGSRRTTPWRICCLGSSVWRKHWS